MHRTGRAPGALIRSNRRRFLKESGLEAGLEALQATDRVAGLTGIKAETAARQ